MAKVRAERKKSPSLLMNFRLEFSRRQELKLIEDTIIDLQGILPAMRTNIEGIRGECEKFLTRECQKQDILCGCGWVLEEFDNFIKETDGYIKQVEVLRQRVISTSTLVCNQISFYANSTTQSIANRSAAIRFIELRGLRCASSRKQIGLRSDGKESKSGKRHCTDMYCR